MFEIVGPVYPITPAFKKDQKIDWIKTRQYIKFLIKNGAKNIIVTAGSSRINLLTDSELHKLNKLVASETIKKKIIGITSNHVYGDLKKTKEFINKSIKNKASAILIYFSERYYGDQELKKFFFYIDKLCGKRIKFLIHAVLLRNEIPNRKRLVPISINLFDYLINLKSFGGIKEEFNLPSYKKKLIKKYKNKMNIISAGSSMRGFKKYHKYGLKSYLTSVGSFNPQIEEHFFKLIYINKNIKSAEELIKKFEVFFEDNKLIGWHLTMKTVLSILGLMQIYERLPLKNTNSKIVSVFKKKIKKIKLDKYEIRDKVQN
tara:strand:+ start:671 stop:1621 length:951 start_codon:yes stop_codon:yes gene_type:complete